MSVQVEQVLALWREAERLLEELPPESPERTRVRDRVRVMRALYHRLTDNFDESRRLIATSRRTIEETALILRDARARLGAD